MRIVGGRWRGKRLADVGAGDPSAQLRPTTDRVRETLFNLLINGRQGDLVTGAHVLDLFAGTGALGLEALSRGAAACVFVENGSVARKLLQQNIRACGASDLAQTVARDARQAGPPPGAKAELVLMDPPYGTSLGETALSAMISEGWLADGAVIAWESEGKPTLPAEAFLRDTRKIGRTTLTLAVFSAR